VNDPIQLRDPIAAGLEWVARITTVSLEMVLPGIAGQWLDERWGTGFLALLGFAIGIPVSIWHLLIMTRTVGQKGDESSSDTDKDTEQ